MTRDDPIKAIEQLPDDFWNGTWPTPALEGDAPLYTDSPPAEDPASLYREAYYAGMADGPVPGTD